MTMGDLEGDLDIETARRYFREREARRHARKETERHRWLQQVGEAVVRLAPDYPDIRRVYLFGSLVRSGCFRPDSDIDIAVDCGTLEAESAFWRALERALKRDVDVRPLIGAIARTVDLEGELIYERQNIDPGEQHPQ